MLAEALAVAVAASSYSDGCGGGGTRALRWSHCRLYFDEAQHITAVQREDLSAHCPFLGVIILVVVVVLLVLLSTRGRSTRWCSAMLRPLRPMKTSAFEHTHMEEDAYANRRKKKARGRAAARCCFQSRRRAAGRAPPAPPAATRPRCSRPAPGSPRDCPPHRPAPAERLGAAAAKHGRGGVAEEEEEEEEEAREICGSWTA